MTSLLRKNILNTLLVKFELTVLVAAAAFFLLILRLPSSNPGLVNHHFSYAKKFHSFNAVVIVEISVSTFIC